MEIFILDSPYDKKKVRLQLKKIGFKQFDRDGYDLGDYLFRIRLSDPEEGRVQLQGHQLNDIYKKREKSKYYTTLENLANIFHAKRIVDPELKDIFPELTKE